MSPGQARPAPPTVATTLHRCMGITTIKTPTHVVLKKRFYDFLRSMSQLSSDNSASDSKELNKAELRMILKRMGKITCLIQGCSKSFTTYQGFLYHQKTCGKEAEQFICEICGMSVCVLHIPGVEIATNPLARDYHIYSGATHYSSLIARWASKKLLQKSIPQNSSELCSWCIGDSRRNVFFELPKFHQG